MHHQRKIDCIFLGGEALFILFCIKGSWREGGYVWSVFGNMGKGGGHAGFFCITKTWQPSSQAARRACKGTTARCDSLNFRPP